MVDAPNKAPAGAQASAGVSLQNIQKSFGQTKVLHNLSFAVSAGSFATLLGPSGCGKTTLLRIIAGLENVDSGKVSLFGRDVTRLPVSQRKCSLLFQSYALFPNLTVAENIAYGLKAQGVRGAAVQEKVRHWLERVDLASYEKRLPAQLSGGQQQRVALARALAVEPQILLLDEPFSALDARVRLHLRTEVRLLQQRLGLTTIMVTHDQNEALSVSDRIFLIKDGTIVQAGSPRELYDFPTDAFAAEFIGRANFLRPCRRIAPKAFEFNGHRFNTAEHPTGEGSEFGLMIRPENLDLGTEPTPGSLPAVVQWSEFEGPKERIRLEATLPESGACMAFELERPSSRKSPVAGSAVHLYIPPSAILAFPLET